MSTPQGPHCPFCRGAISLDLAQYGGNCPHCMLEVPGDEAPTDPGAVLRQKQAEERMVAEAAEARKRRVRLGVLAVVLVALAGVVGWQYQAWRARHTYEVVQYFELPLEDIAAAPAPVAPPPEAVVAASGGTSGGARPSGGRPSGGSSGATAPPSGGTAVAASGAGTEDAAPVGLAVTTGAVSLGSGGDVPIVKTDEVLTDEREILEMIKRVVYGSSPQLEACYQQRLKQAPDLAGVWEVSFVVTRSGIPASVGVKPRNRPDGELEACLRNAVSSWRFLKINADKPISRPYRFGST